MEYRRLGDSGLVVSAVGLGCNNFGRRLDASATRAVVDAAIDSGVTLFDTADVYGAGASEDQLGLALEGRRGDVVVATKFGADAGGLAGADWGARGSRRYIRTAVEGSLRRLRTDWIDLYQMHMPDPRTPIAETLDALDELVREGKVRYVGCSNFAAWQIADADWSARGRGRAPFISVQNRYSLLDRTVEAEVTPASRRFGVGILPFFPLENGLLTGKYRRGQAPEAGTRLSERTSVLEGAPWDTVERLETFAAERDVTLLHVAVAGLAAQPQVGSVIAGATKPEQVRANVAAGTWKPTAEDVRLIDEITAGN
jgi:aryl-alcohol dehydrogenase-like predicted oxidoreductase